MPDFRGMFTEQYHPDSTFDEKEYDSLYDELIEKCHPNRYFSGKYFNEKLFEEANRLYAEVLKCEGASEDTLISLRNRAMDTLGINISTKKKYEHLDSIFNPKVYTDVDPNKYDAERVSEAARWYKILQEKRNDIRALEALEIDASDFIDRRKGELYIIEPKEEENGGEENGDDYWGTSLLFFFFSQSGFLLPGQHLINKTNTNDGYFFKLLEQNHRVVRRQAVEECTYTRFQPFGQGSLRTGYSTSHDGGKDCKRRPTLPAPVLKNSRRYRFPHQSLFWPSIDKTRSDQHWHHHLGKRCSCAPNGYAWVGYPSNPL